MKKVWLAFFLFGCGADDFTRQGNLGEFCNGRDTDCRPGLLCQQQVCVNANPSPFDCDAICERFDSCEASIESCAVACRITVETWSSRALEAFGQCVVEDLTCEEIDGSFAPQTCYERIPIDADREQACEQAQSRCSLSDDARRGCFRSARVDIESEWQKSEACVSEIRTCDEVNLCLETGR